MAKKYEKGRFFAQVDEWCTQAEDRLLWIFMEAVQRVISKMQEVGPSKARGGQGTGHMPVDTGYLRSSLVVQLNNLSATKTVKPKDVQAFAYDDSQVSMVIVAAKLGDSIYAAYTAAYARRLEYGFSGTDSAGRTVNQEGYAFVRLAVQQWQSIVNEVVAEAKSRSA